MNDKLRAKLDQAVDLIEEVMNDVDGDGESYKMLSEASRKVSTVQQYGE